MRRLFIDWPNVGVFKNCYFQYSRWVQKKIRVYEKIIHRVTKSNVDGPQISSANGGDFTDTILLVIEGRKEELRLLRPLVKNCGTGTPKKFAVSVLPKTKDNWGFAVYRLAYPRFLLFFFSRMSKKMYGLAIWWKIKAMSVPKLAPDRNSLMGMCGIRLLPTVPEFWHWCGT